MSKRLINSTIVVVFILCSCNNEKIIQKPFLNVYSIEKFIQLVLDDITIHHPIGYFIQPPPPEGQIVEYL